MTPGRIALPAAVAIAVLGAWTYASGQRISPARARSIPEAATGDSGAGTEATEAGPATVKGVRSALTVARICHLEATFSETDCAAIYWVAAKRAARHDGDTLRVLWRYSVLRRLGTPRAREVAAYPWGDVPGKTASFNRKWREQREFAQRLVAGEVPDPCPSAVHFGGRMDRAPKGTVPARCAAQQSTANVLYARGED